MNLIIKTSRIISDKIRSTKTTSLDTALTKFCKNGILNDKYLLFNIIITVGLDCAYIQGTIPRVISRTGLLQGRLFLFDFRIPINI